MPPAFSTNQGFGQHPPAVVQLNPLERHNLRCRMEGLLQERLTGRAAPVLAHRIVPHQRSAAGLGSDELASELLLERIETLTVPD